MTHQDTPPIEPVEPAKQASVKNTAVAAGATGAAAIVAIWAAAGFHWPPPEEVTIAFISACAPTAHLIARGVQSRLEKWAGI